MLAQIYLAIDRLDLAEQTLRSMQQIDDDDTLTTFVAAWVNLRKVCRQLVRFA